MILTHESESRYIETIDLPMDVWVTIVALGQHLVEADPEGSVAIEELEALGLGELGEKGLGGIFWCLTVSANSLHGVLESVYGGRHDDR